MLPCVSRRGPYSPDDLQHLSEQLIEDTMSDETAILMDYFATPNAITTHNIARQPGQEKQKDTPR